MKVPTYSSRLDDGRNGAAKSPKNTTTAHLASAAPAVGGQLAAVSVQVLLPVLVLPSSPALPTVLLPPLPSGAVAAGAV